jgi:hypothetical protein
MRILYAVLFGWLWILFIGIAITSGLDISSKTFLLTTSIVVAGALAGGD